MSDTELNIDNLISRLLEGINFFKFLFYSHFSFINIYIN